MKKHRRAYEQPHGEVQDRAEFADSLAHMFAGMHRFIHAAREWTLPATIDGNSLYDEGTTPLTFQAAWQYERPQEFQQSLMDILRVVFDPNPPGTFMLNANYGLLEEAVPDTPFRLAYLSELGRPGESVQALKSRAIDPRCQALGFEQGIGPMFGTLCAGQGSVVHLVRDYAALFDAGFSVKQALSGMAQELGAAAVDPASDGPICHLGYSIDPALADRFRVSLWRFVPRDDQP